MFGRDPAPLEKRFGSREIDTMSAWWEIPQIPFVSYGPGKYNGGDTFRLVEFDADADEDGEVVALGEPVDLTP